MTISGLVREVATSVSKISKDLRLMSSGPCAGSVKINLPALLPGFSFMPRKINPTVPEMVIQIAHQVVGNDVAIAMTYDEGELDLNVWNATFCKCLFERMQWFAEERFDRVVDRGGGDVLVPRRRTCRSLLRTARRDGREGRRRDGTHD